MDMWDPYVASVSEHLQDGSKKIVYDKFHVAKHLGEAVDRVRRKEIRTLRAAGDDRLTGTRYDWLRNPAAMEPADRKAFAELRQSGLKTARAWALKETAMAFFSYQYERPARKHFRWWHGWAVRSRLRPMLEVARTLKRRFENSLPISTTASPTLPANPSMPRSSGSSTRRAVSATRRISEWQFYSIVAVWTWPLKPLKCRKSLIIRLLLLPTSPTLPSGS